MLSTFCDQIELKKETNAMFYQQVETRADYGRALEELISPWPWDERYAPSDESFE